MESRDRYEPRRPERPPAPGTEPRRRVSIVPALFTVLVAGMLFGGLVMLSQGLLLPVLFIGGGVLAMVVFHYVLWGWWLGDAIRHEVEEEEREGRE